MPAGRAGTYPRGRKRGPNKCGPGLDSPPTPGQARPMNDLADLTASATLARIAAGTISFGEVREALAARVAEREPVVRAFTHLNPDPMPGPGPLAGCFFGVKDVLDTADAPSQYGSPIWAGWQPRGDAACVALARTAGGAVMGKTVTTEFATRHPGPTTNPHNPAHSPGGSSSGSAAGVAAGFFHIGLGTQTGGSILRPAAYCGVVGFKPSFGALHRGGMKVMSESLDTIGVITRSVADAALAMAAMTGGDYGRPDSAAPRPPRLALVDANTPETEGLMASVADACRARGAAVVVLKLPAIFAAAMAAHPWVMNMESAQALAFELATAPEKLSPGLRARMLEARAAPATRLTDGRAAFHAAQDAFAAAIAGFDAVLTPAAPGEAPRGLDDTGDPVFNSLWTLLHTPAVSVPIGHGPHGLPLGAQIVTPLGQDAACLMWGEWVRQAVTG